MEAYEEKETYQKKQERLHKKHMIDDENVIIVEKNNMIKFSITSMIRLIHFTASVILVILAMIGLICLTFEETRLPFVDLLNNIVLQIKTEL